MADRKISLSQAELDKLMGVDSGVAEVDESTISSGEREQVKIICSQNDIDSFTKVMSRFCEKFKELLKNEFGEPRLRKLNISTVELIKACDFASEVVLPAFIYKITLDGNFVIIKLDSFLYCALSGVAIDRRLKPNKFQYRVLEKVVLPIMLKAFFDTVGYDFDMSGVSVESIASEDFKNLEEIKNDKTGVLTVINWNEDYSSFGVEKIFISKQLFAEIKNKKWLIS